MTSKDKKEGSKSSQERIHASESTVLSRDACILRLIETKQIEVDARRGDIYSLRRPKERGRRVLLTGTLNKGYRLYTLYDKETKRNWGIRGHHLVWVAANGAIENPDWMMIDHINRDRQDNSLANLRLVTAQGNADNTTVYGQATCHYPPCDTVFDRKKPKPEDHLYCCTEHRLEHHKEKMGRYRSGTLNCVCEDGVFSGGRRECNEKA